MFIPSSENFKCYPTLFLFNLCALKKTACRKKNNFGVQPIKPLSKQKAFDVHVNSWIFLNSNKTESCQKKGICDLCKFYYKEEKQLEKIDNHELKILL